jgi:hypothetical protein
MKNEKMYPHKMFVFTDDHSPLRREALVVLERLSVFV